MALGKVLAAIVRILRMFQQMFSITLRVLLSLRSVFYAIVATVIFLGEEPDSFSQTENSSWWTYGRNTPQVGVDRAALLFLWAIVIWLSMIRLTPKRMVDNTLIRLMYEPVAIIVFSRLIMKSVWAEVKVISRAIEVFVFCWTETRLDVSTMISALTLFWAVYSAVKNARVPRLPVRRDNSEGNLENPEENVVYELEEPAGVGGDVSGGCPRSQGVDYSCSEGFLRDGSWISINMALGKILEAIVRILRMFQQMFSITLRVLLSLRSVFYAFVATVIFLGEEPDSFSQTENSSWWTYGRNTPQVEVDRAALLFLWAIVLWLSMIRLTPKRMVDNTWIRIMYEPVAIIVFSRLIMRSVWAEVKVISRAIEVFVFCWTETRLDVSTMISALTLLWAVYSAIKNARVSRLPARCDHPDFERPEEDVLYELEPVGIDGDESGGCPRSQNVD